MDGKNRRLPVPVNPFFSDAEARLIAGRAMTLRERVNRGGAGAGSERTTERWRTEWQKILGGPEALVARLDELGLAEPEGVLHDVPLCESEALPTWVQVVDRALTAIGNEEVVWREGTDSLPFHEVSEAFVNESWRMVQRAAPHGVGLLSDEATSELRSASLQWITTLLAPVLEAEFVAFRSVRQQLRGGFQILGSLPDVVSREQYQDFVADLLRSGMHRVLLEFPVLARMLGRVIELGARAETTFLEHLVADLDDVGEAFGVAPADRRVAALRSGLSDRHHGGRTVKIVTFASGKRVVYKPKPVALERVFSDFQGWLNDQIAPGFRPMGVLDRGDHGWVEFIEHKPCETPEQVANYFRRAGALVAVIYALEGTDYHNENLIAHGEFPVPIDQEGLFHHRARMVDATGRITNNDQTAGNQLAHSVIRTALLPFWRFGEKGRSLDISALGGHSDEESFVKMPRWEHVNTDRMRLVYEHSVSRDVNTNVVRLDGVIQSVNDHAHELEEGFTTGYRALMTMRESLLGSGGWVDAFADQLVRFIYRDTRVYFMLQRHSLSPRFMRSGLDRSIQLEILYRGFLPRPGEPAHPLRLLIESEIASIEDVDIPMFQPRSSSADLETPGGVFIKSCFVEPSLDGVRKRIELLGEEDLALQTRVLRGSLATRTVRPQQERSNGSEGRGEIFTPLDRSALINEGESIAGAIGHAAVWQDDSTASWLGFTHVIEANRSQLQQLPWTLYDGSVGVAFFLGALRHVLPGSESGALAARLALGAVAPMRNRLRQLTAKGRTVQQIVKDLGLGSGVGAGSLIYSFVHLAQWLGEEELLCNAEELASGYCSEVIAADDKLDVMFGAAGGILALLALYRTRPDHRWMDRAVMCGEHLLAKRRDGVAGSRSWNDQGERPLTGMSHGAAGYAQALFALAAASGRENFADAAREAVSYEDSVYREEERNWPDFRPPVGDPPPCRYSWCHGAPGVLLSRVETLGMHDNKNARRDIDAALETTLDRSLSPIDHLCCGNLGRADIILTSALRLGRSDLLDASGSIMAAVVARARQKGGYGLGHEPEYCPGFFQGLSGVGYSLLRQAFPSELPSVLSWA